MNGAWNRYLHEVDEECHREVELAVKRTAEKEGVTEQLKSENPMEWVMRVNGIKGRVGEVVWRNETLKGQRVKNEEIKKLVNSVAETINLISQEKKPQLISYFKSYMGWKSRHKRELLLDGKIQYIKYPDCNEKTDLEN